MSPTAISQKLVELTATKLKAFQERSLADFQPFALFLDTIHRGGKRGNDNHGAAQNISTDILQLSRQHQAQRNTTDRQS